eukprot:gene11671-34392_t
MRGGHDDCSCDKKQRGTHGPLPVQNRSKNAPLAPLIATLLGSLLSSSCCVIQLLLNLLNFGCAGFAIMNPYSPYLRAATACVFSAYAVKYGIWSSRALLTLACSLLLMLSQDLVSSWNQGSLDVPNWLSLGGDGSFQPQLNPSWLGLTVGLLRSHPSLKQEPDYTSGTGGAPNGEVVSTIQTGRVVQPGDGELSLHTGSQSEAGDKEIPHWIHASQHAVHVTELISASPQATQAACVTSSSLYATQHVDSKGPDPWPDPTSAELASTVDEVGSMAEVVGGGKLSPTSLGDPVTSAERTWKSEGRKGDGPSWPVQPTPRGLRTLRFLVRGIKCEGCASKLKLSVKEIGGVDEAYVSYLDGVVVLLLSPSVRCPSHECDDMASTIQHKMRSLDLSYNPVFLG